MSIAVKATNAQPIQTPMNCSDDDDDDDDYDNDNQEATHGQVKVIGASFISDSVALARMCSPQCHIGKSD